MDKRIQYQNLPFWVHMKRTGPYCEIKEQENVIISLLNAYYKTLCNAYIFKDIKCNLVKVKRKFQTV